MVCDKAEVETLRKPSTGLKHTQRLLVVGSAAVETLRKPSTGLKRCKGLSDLFEESSRDTQKTQHGIETLLKLSNPMMLPRVETLRKPSTGLKHSKYRLAGIALGGSRHSENPARD